MASEGRIVVRSSNSPGIGTATTTPVAVPDMHDARTVGVFAVDGTNAYAATGLVAVLRAAESLDCGVESTVYSLVPTDAVTADDGFGLVPDDVLIGTPDAVVVPGGAGPVATVDHERDLADRVAQLHDAGAVAVGIGTGVGVLGDAGVLSGRPVSAPDRLVDGLPEDVSVVDAPAVDDGDVVTAARPGSGASLGLYLLEEVGCDRVDAVADQVGVAREDVVRQS